MNEETTRDGYVWVNRTIYNSLTKEVLSEDESHERIAVPNFNGLPTGRATISGHITKNLGNFESARIGVELSLPTLPTQEELVRVSAELQEIVGELLAEQVQALDEPIKVVA